MTASWSELFRHFTAGGVDPFEIRRRVGRIRLTNLQALDLTNPDAQSALNMTEKTLTGEDYQPCQDLAEAARSLGYDAVLAPSAASPGNQTLAVFPVALNTGKTTIESDRLQVPPITLIRALPNIRPVEPATLAYWAYVDALSRLAPAVLRKRYRRH